MALSHYRQAFRDWIFYFGLNETTGALYTRLIQTTSMKRLVILLIALFTLCHPSIGQEDSSLIQKDSVPPITSFIDSTWTIITPWPPYQPLPFIWDNITWICPSIIFESRYTAKGAKADLKAGSAHILFSGGFGGMPDFSSEKDKEFQQKYGVEFFSQGCVHMGAKEDEAVYNRVVFAYLDKKYGKTWRYHLRNDAIGFEAPVLPEVDVKQLASSLAFIHLHPSRNFNPVPITDKHSKMKLLIIQVGSVLMVIRLILFLLFRQRKKS